MANDFKIIFLSWWGVVVEKSRLVECLFANGWILSMALVLPKLVEWCGTTNMSWKLVLCDGILKFSLDRIIGHSIFPEISLNRKGHSNHVVVLVGWVSNGKLDSHNSSYLYLCLVYNYPSLRIYVELFPRMPYEPHSRGSILRCSIQVYFSREQQTRIWGRQYFERMMLSAWWNPRFCELY